jgi:hypothetical protein
MERADQIGYEIPIVCPRHPSITHLISEPGELPEFAPEGGCVTPCESVLPCGHICPSVVYCFRKLICPALLLTRALQCHTDQDDHRRMKCNELCQRVICPRAHPCPFLCSDHCGNCKFPIYEVELPCNHTAESVPWRVLSKSFAHFYRLIPFLQSHA